MSRFTSQSGAEIYRASLLGRDSILVDREKFRSSIVGWTLALLIASGFFAATHVYWQPSAGGVDQNGYLLGGLMIAQHRASGISLPDPFVDLGPHWIMVGENRFVLKFPPGLPAIYALIRAIGGARHWAAASHLLSPLCAAFALVGCYALFEPIVGAFFALLGMLILASSPVIIIYANTPNSHAAALCCVTWGMAMLLHWRRSRGIICAVAAGALLGYAATIRYTEGLLFVPLALVLWQKLRDRSTRETAPKQSIAMLVAWTAPLLALLAFNLITIGYANGYALTHESTAFGIHYFFRNATLMVDSLDHLALQWLLPIALLGGILMLGFDRPLALVLWTWGLGAILLYTAYYWSSQSGVTYLRFVLTAFPAIVLMAMWLLQRVHTWLGARWIGAVAAGALAAVSASLNLISAAPLAEQNHWNDLQCRIMDQHLLAATTSGSTVFTQRPNIPHLEVAGNWRFYLTNAFTPDWVHFLGQRTTDNGSPQILQRERAAALYELLKNDSPAELIARQNQLILDSAKRGQNVYALLPKPAMQQFITRFLPREKFSTSVVDQWDVDPRCRAIVRETLVDSDGAEYTAAPDTGAAEIMQIVKITPR